MSTRSLIAIENPDGSCRSIYCHSDGYPSHNGRLLIEHYNSPERVAALLALGALSCLAPRLSPDSGEKHDYDNPVDDICIAYHRDRNEAYRATVWWSDAGHMLDKAADNYWADYVYLFRNGSWYVSSTYRQEDWQPVADVLKEHDDE